MKEVGSTPWRAALGLDVNILTLAGFNDGVPPLSYKLAKIFAAKLLCYWKLRSREEPEPLAPQVQMSDID